MKNKGLIVGLFSLLALVQIIVPLSMISNKESIIRDGFEFKFKTAPIDPYDAFRGRYVWLSIKENDVAVPCGFNLKRGQTVYAFIEVGEDGFAKFSSITEEKPYGLPYIKTKASYVFKGKARLELPFERYYMEEGSAPKAEKIYRQHSNRDKQDAYLTVKIKDGQTAITGLYVAGERIEDAVKKIE
ncbi:hypothetical protein EPO66_00585 [bacterium]|nr:MAG: hypothetical protein EPO66_00585 [bacterium]